MGKWSVTAPSPIDRLLLHLAALPINEGDFLMKRCIGKPLYALEVQGGLAA